MLKIIKKCSKLRKHAVSFSIVVIAILLLSPFPCFASLCSEPPFVSVSIVPNVLLVLDNSASMYDLAYVDDNPTESYCYDDSYESPYDSYTSVPGKTYYGYYDPSAWYEYSGSQFVETGTPSITNCYNRPESQSDYCLKIEGESVQAVFRGNVLNWMTMSKLDVEKRVLTGGKYEDGVLIGESRGCLGRRFIKEIKCWVQKGHGNSKKYELHGSGIVFAITGKNTNTNEECDSSNLFEPGETSIEVYKLPNPDDTDSWEGSMEACIEAIQQFCDTTEHGGFGKAQNNIKECLGYKPGVGADKWETDPGKEHRYGFAAFIHSVHICWHLNPAHSPGRPTPTPGDMQSIMSICKGQYAHLKKDLEDSDDEETTIWDLLDDPLNSSFICSRYTSGDNQEVGIGWCYTGDGTTHSWGDPHNLDGDSDPDVNDPDVEPDTSDTEDCVRHQLLNFCSSSELPLVVDPSEEFGLCGSSDDSYEYGYIPAMIIELGVLSQLTEDGCPIAIFQNTRASQTPTGLLHKVKSKVKLGLMVNNQYGSAFELTSEDRDNYGCTDVDADGGKVSSLITLDNDDVIDKVNIATALNWTPIGETFYEMTRYFRGMSPAYLSGEDYSCPVDDYCQSNNVVLISDSHPTRDKNVPGTSFGTSTVSDESNFNAENVLTSIGVDNDFNEKLPLDGTTYAVAAAYWGHTYDGKWAGGTNDNPNDKNLNFYTIFALGGTPPPDDENILRHIAKYGGFVDGNSNGLPDTGEWDGHNYIEAKDAFQLESALTQIFYEIASVGAAGAVATVTQEMESDDLLVRAGFETDDPTTSNIDWKGHLEVYIPYEGCSGYSTQPDCENIAGCSWVDNSCTGSMYSFQQPSNWGKFCSASDTASGYCWDGGRTMPAHSSRTIFTLLNGTQTSFAQANANTLKQYLDNDVDFQNLGCSTKTSDTACASISGCWWNNDECQPAANNLINWVRGDTTYDGGTARDRKGWILGDVVYSTPVVIGAPSLASVDPAVIGSECTNFTGCKNLPQNDCNSNTYCVWAGNSCNVDLSSQYAAKCFYTFREANLTRKKVVYVGANDGMLHAFVVGKYDSSNDRWLYRPSEDSEIGTELWAYIPSNFLSELKELARLSYGNDPGCKHRYMVDLSSQAWDVFIDHDGNREWRTVILGGERGGGDVYFAVDVTDPDNPSVLWEYSPIRNLLELDEDGTTYAYSYSYDDYMKIKTLPTSWSMPYAGRLNISSAVTFPVNTVTPLNSSTPAVGSYSEQDASDRWFAFVGGGFRLYDSTSIDSEAVDLKALQKPNLFAIDIETGNNILQYVWPRIQHAYASEWPPPSEDDDIKIPYSMANTVAYDLWGLNAQGSRVTMPDGAVDHIFVGDLSGLLWGLRIDPASAFGLQIDLWETKNVPNGAYGYRGARQPITVTPVGALDSVMGSSSLNLHLYYGTGKFDDIDGPENDKNDAATMSFYGLTLPLNSFTPSGTSTSIEVGTSPSFFTARLNRHAGATYCTGPSDDWINVEGQSCCYECLLDLIASGERVVDSALVASAMVFFTTFIPDMNTSCSAGGNAYIYAVDYLCRNLSMDPFAESGLSYSWLGEGNPTNGSLPDGQQAKAFRARVGAGMPSRPILDSSGKFLFVQTSDARIHKIKVKLPGNPLKVKGWKEEN